MKIRATFNGETVDLDVPDGATIQTLFQHVPGGNTAAGFRRNGQPADLNTTLQNGDRVAGVTAGGKLAFLVIVGD